MLKNYHYLINYHRVIQINIEIILEKIITLLEFKYLVNTCN